MWSPVFKRNLFSIGYKSCGVIIWKMGVINRSRSSLWVVSWKAIILFKRGALVLRKGTFWAPLKTTRSPKLPDLKANFLIPDDGWLYRNLSYNTSIVTLKHRFCALPFRTRNLQSAGIMVQNDMVVSKTVEEVDLFLPIFICYLKQPWVIFVNVRSCNYSVPSISYNVSIFHYFLRIHQTNGSRRPNLVKVQLIKWKSLSCLHKEGLELHTTPGVVCNYIRK